MTTNLDSEANGEAQTEPLSVTRVIDHPVSRVWSALIAPHGAEALLGEGGELGTKGASWRATDGTFGVTRSFHPEEQIRFSWHADDSAPATLVDVHLQPEGEERTRLEIRHDHLDDNADRAGLEERWTSALNRLDSAAL